MRVRLLLACLILGGAVAVLAGGCTGQSASLRPLAASGAATMSNAVQSPQVIVYYMHRTFRCLSCLWIENEVRKTLKKDFAADLVSGRLEMRVADFWIEKDLAARYNVDTVSVVVARLSQGRETSHQTLDRVWELKGESGPFRAYLAGAVKVALAEEAPPPSTTEGSPTASAVP